MSYVSETQRANPATMGAALLINGSIILALALSPVVVEQMPDATVIIGRHIEDRPPPPEMPMEQRQAEQAGPVFVPDRRVATQVVPDPSVVMTSTQTETGTIFDGSGAGDDMTSEVRDLTPIPVFKAAWRDPRFARDFQPDYPVGKLKLEIEGSATVRVLIGTDGRVRQVQVIRATDPDFARATQRQAIRAWRFRPATSDGVLVEDWQTLTVRFDINQQDGAISAGNRALHTP